MINPETQKFFQELFQKLPKQPRTLAQIRFGFEKLMADFPAQKEVQFHPFSIGKLSAAWIHAPSSTRDRVILFFHGGGFLAGSYHSHQDLIGRLASATSCDVLALDYRLAPEHPFPAALEDALLSYEYLLKEKFSPQNIFLAGTSAGGGLALSLLLKLKDLKKKLPRGAICICPWVDLALTGKTLKTNEGKDLIHAENIKAAASIYLAGHSPKDPLASPLYGNLEGFPPLLIQVGSREVFLDEIDLFAQKAKSCKVEVQLQLFDEMIHTWHLFSSKVIEGREAVEKIGEFVRSLIT